MPNRLGKLRLFLLVAAASTARATLVVNGDFESPGAAFTTDYAALSTNTLPGWTSTPGNGTGANNYLSTTNSTANWIPNPQSGNYSVQLDSSTSPANYTVGGMLSQTITLTANTQYLLTFYMSAEVNRVDAGNNPISTISQLNVILNGGGFLNQNMVNAATGTTGFQATSDGLPKATPELTWKQWSLLFTPTINGDVTITFQDVWVSNGTSSNASLDNVDLSIVPEIGDWRIFAGFVAFVVIAAKFQSKRRSARASD